MYDTIRFTHTVDPNGHLYMICRCPAFSRCSMQSKCAFLSIAQENHFQREMKSTSQATMISDVVISFIFFAIISSNKIILVCFSALRIIIVFKWRNPFKENHLFHRSQMAFRHPNSPFNQPIPKGIQPPRTLKCPVGLKMCWILLPLFFVGSWKIKKKSGPCQKKSVGKPMARNSVFKTFNPFFNVFDIFL